MRMEQLGRVTTSVDAEQKQQMLNVSAEFTSASRDNFFGPVPVMSLEGVYNPEVGRMHLIGCRNVHAPWRVLSNLSDLEDGMDCSIEVTVEYPPTATRWLVSTRANGDPLHFNTTELRTLPVVYSEQRREEVITEPMVEALLSVAGAVGHRRRHRQPAPPPRVVESHADVAPYVSLATLGAQALGYGATLVTDAETLPPSWWPARRYKYKADYYAVAGWDMECSVKALTLAALFLTARLAQKVRRSRARARARASPLEPGRVPRDGAVMLCTAGVHLFFVLAVHWLSTHGGSGTSTGHHQPPGGEAQGMASRMRTRAAIVEGYVGVVKEWFLLPQVIGNALWRVNCKPLVAGYYAGVTAAGLLPHVYGYLRPPVVNREFEAQDGVVEFYSKASAVVVPVVGLVLALVVYVQQRWNYKIVGWAMRTKNKLQHVY
ncbi:unnamed protein product [Urochloa humidicola]